MNVSFWNEVRLTHWNPWSLYVNYGKDPIMCKVGMWAKGGYKGHRRQAGTGELCVEGRSLASWDGGIIEDKLFTSPFYEGAPCSPTVIAEPQPSWMFRSLCSSFLVLHLELTLKVSSMWPSLWGFAQAVKTN